MKRIKYPDGTFSRDVEDDEADDWETLHDTEANKSKKVSIMHVRDELTNIKSLLHVCAMALEGSTSDSYLQEKILEVIVCTVIPMLEESNRELGKV